MRGFTTAILLTLSIAASAQFVKGPVTAAVNASKRRIVPSDDQVRRAKGNLSSPSKTVRLRALEVLAGCDTIAVEPAILQAIHDPQITVQRAAVDAYFDVISNCDAVIQRMPGDKRQRASDALMARIDALDTPSGMVAPETFRIVMSAGRDPADGRRVLKRIVPPEYRVRRNPSPDPPDESQAVLDGDIFTCGVGPEFEFALSSFTRRWPNVVAAELEDPRSELAWRLLSHITQIRSQRLGRAVISRTQSKQWGDRLEACRALVSYRTAGAMAALKTCTKDRYAVVRSAAYQSLASHLTGEAFWRLVADGLHDPLARVRDDLAVLAVARDLPGAKRLLDRLQQASTPEAQLAGVALGNTISPPTVDIRLHKR